MKIQALHIAMISIATIGITACATAQGFTFTSTNNDQTQIGMAPGEGPSAGTWTSASTARFADGSTITSTSNCVSMSQPPNNTLFAMHSFCDGTSEAGDWTLVMGCSPMGDDSGRLACVGTLIGKTGDFEGRQGGISFMGDGDTSTGSGQWYAKAPA